MRIWSDGIISTSRPGRYSPRNRSLERHRRGGYRRGGRRRSVVFECMKLWTKAAASSLSWLPDSQPSEKAANHQAERNHPALHWSSEQDTENKKLKLKKKPKKHHVAPLQYLNSLKQVVSNLQWEPTKEQVWQRTFTGSSNKMNSISLKKITLLWALTNTLDTILCKQRCSQTRGTNTKRQHCEVIVPVAVHQWDGVTATAEVSSCVPVVNDIWK